MTATARGESITSLCFGAEGEASSGTSEEQILLERVETELKEYAQGRRRNFDLPLNPEGTPFQRQVWEQLTAIPYGERKTYGALTAVLGKPAAARAVGAACGKNPIVVLIPCHRVVGRDGSLTGYSALGGTETKRRLLELEQKFAEETP
jgi:methylated-DNA-[protein]-cysteine S-methyltransferase